MVLEAMWLDFRVMRTSSSVPLSLSWVDSLVWNDLFLWSVSLLPHFSFAFLQTGNMARHRKNCFIFYCKLHVNTVTLSHACGHITEYFFLLELTFFAVTSPAFEHKQLLGRQIKMLSIYFKNEKKPHKYIIDKKDINLSEFSRQLAD